MLRDGGKDLVLQELHAHTGPLRNYGRLKLERAS